MSHASRSAHIADLIDDLADLYLAQVADLREFAQATEAGDGTLHLDRPCVIGRSAGLTSTGSSSWPPSPAPYSGGRPQRARSARGQLMPPSCRRASDNLYVPVSKPLSYIRRCPSSPAARPATADSPELFHLGLGGTTRNLPAGECGVSA